MTGRPSSSKARVRWQFLIAFLGGAVVLAALAIAPRLSVVKLELDAKRIDFTIGQTHDLSMLDGEAIEIALLGFDGVRFQSPSCSTVVGGQILELGATVSQSRLIVAGRLDSLRVNRGDRLTLEVVGRSAPGAKVLLPPGTLDASITIAAGSEWKCDECAAFGSSPTRVIGACSEDTTLTVSKRAHGRSILQLRGESPLRFDVLSLPLLRPSFFGDSRSAEQRSAITGGRVSLPEFKGRDRDLSATETVEADPVAQWQLVGLVVDASHVRAEMAGEVRSLRVSGDEQVPSLLFGTLATQETLVEYTKLLVLLGTTILSITNFFRSADDEPNADTRR